MAPHATTGFTTNTTVYITIINLLIGQENFSKNQSQVLNKLIAFFVPNKIKLVRSQKFLLNCLFSA